MATKSKKSKEITIRSSAAEYLTFVSAIGDQPESVELRYQDENIWLTQRLMAELYGVEVRILNQSVKRNLKRFPSDFMFQLNKDEWEILKSQFVISKWGGVRFLPYAFTEQGVAMLSGVLRSTTAIQVNIRIMRAFVAVRQYIAVHQCNNCRLEGEVKQLAAYIEELLADQNEINEDTRNAIALLEAAVFTEPTAEKPKRIFNLEVKGFKKEE